MRALLVAALFAALGAQAQPNRSVDLDQPGALAALERENPEHYQLVLDEVRRAESMNCTAFRGLLRAQTRPEHERCRSYMIGTSWPAKTHLAIPVGDVRYVITAYIDTSVDRLAPAR